MTFAGNSNWTAYPVPALPPPAAPPADGVSASAGGQMGHDMLQLGNRRPVGEHNASLLQRLRDPRTRAVAAYELAQLPTLQMVEIASGILGDPQMRDRETQNLVVAGLLKRVRDPLVVEALRVYLDAAGLAAAAGVHAANVKAAVALIHVGDVRDLARVLPLLPRDTTSDPALQRILIDQLRGQKELLNHPATVDMLIATLGHGGAMLALSAARALGSARGSKARDALGESVWLSDPRVAPSEAVQVLGQLANHAGPYSARTLQNLRRLASHRDGALSSEAKKILGRPSSSR